MKRHIYTSDTASEFSTFEIHDVEAIFSYAQIVTGAKRFIHDIEEKRKFSDELFAFINEAYDDLGGFRSFKDMDRFVNDSYLWYITYDGPRPSENELDSSRIYVVSVYRRNHGLKLVGLARRKLLSSDSSRSVNISIRQKANAAVVAHLQFMAQRGWAEVSDALEHLCFKHLGDRYVIDSQDLINHKIFSSIELGADYYHYMRPLRKGGPMLYKVAFGTIKW